MAFTSHPAVVELRGLIGRVQQKLLNQQNVIGTLKRQGITGRLLEKNLKIKEELQESLEGLLEYYSCYSNSPP